MSWITPITNRTQADVDYVAELRAMFAVTNNVTGIQVADLGTGYYIQFTGTQAQLNEWMAGLKGAYNAADLNRIGNDIQYLAEEMSGYGYAIDASARTDWACNASRIDTPTLAEMTALIADLNAIKSTFGLQDTVPETMDNLTYETANQIETILLNAYLVLNHMINSFVYSGEAYAGGI